MACTRFRVAAWLLLSIFLVGFVLFFVSYVGNSWYVVPNERAHYPPAPSSTYAPDSISRPIRFGLFWMCVGKHCNYDLRVDYMIVKYLPYKDLAFAYQQYRTAVMAIATIAASFCMISLGLYFAFLAGFTFSHFLGFAAGGSQIISGIAALIAVILFGSMFRGSTAMSPFGWSFGLMIVALIILIINGVMTIILSVAIYINIRKKSLSSSAKSLTANF